jgi:L-threonylcarbamoyladenylate synthase
MALNDWQIEPALRALSSGGIVLHATEGVWGFACNPFDAVAVARLLALKKRSATKGLIVIGDLAARFDAELAGLSGSDRALVVSAWPGALTWILPNRQFPCWITGGRETVAVRVPDHPQARALCRGFNGPLVSTSANLAGQRAPVTELQARVRFSRRQFPWPVDYILPGSVIAPGQPSEIRTLSGRVLRGAS